MSVPITLSKKEARQLTLSAQGFTLKNPNSLSIIDRLSYIQIDTISVTERAHNHVLYSRNSKFDTSELDQLMQSKAIFEYWSHAAAYLPIKDYCFSLYTKNLYKAGHKHWFPRDKKTEQYVIDRIKAEGALQSKDFDRKGSTKHGWGQFKPAKMAMTNLFMDGDIMISQRKGFQKIFDLTERVIPSHIQTTTPSLDEFCKHLINNAIKAHGFACLQEIIYLRKGVKPTTSKLLKTLVETNELIPISIEGLSETYYTNSKQLGVLNLTTKRTKQLHILNPFDNLIIQRKRTTNLFNFEYLLECYVPEKKRKYGYYTLPILFNNELVARIDAKADRKTKTLTIKNFWIEKKFIPNDMFKQLYQKQLLLFAEFCGCNRVTDLSDFKY